MYMDAAYWHNSRLDIMDKTHPLFVTSCGTYRLINKPKLPTHRPKGRSDFQLLYIASGQAHFFFQGEEQIVPAGNMVIYRPKEEQRYYYYGTDHTEVYWIHFTGCEVKKILRTHGISDDMKVIHTGISLEYKQLFLQMIHELKLCKEDYEELLKHLLSQLFILIHRAIHTKPCSQTDALMQEMDASVKYFHQNYNKQISIKEFALSRHMSISWFIRSFKEYTHSTPAQYLLALRISNAQTLLASTDYNISEIAEIVGYDNPLYFSRLFKKQCGLSPTDFRKELMKGK